MNHVPYLLKKKLVLALREAPIMTKTSSSNSPPKIKLVKLTKWSVFEMNLIKILEEKEQYAVE